ncbi:MAG: nucleotide exchange factor GrpE [Planctomycetes bacterium]|nr:nucleotide exchange factor GrpE [Planctomycetota bacterium]
MNEPANETPHPEAEAPQGDGAPEANEGGGPDVGGPDQIAQERDELIERLQRVSAEFENYQKRVKRDRLKWSADAVRGVLESMVPVLDNLDFAIAAFDKEGSDLPTLRKGVNMVREELLHQLGNRGVKKLEVDEGTPFDPELHLAINVVEEEGLEQEVVSFCARPGYTIDDTVVRPAQVGVKKPAAV